MNVYGVRSYERKDNSMFVLTGQRPPKHPQHTRGHQLSQNGEKTLSFNICSKLILRWTLLAFLEEGMNRNLSKVSYFTIQWHPLYSSWIRMHDIGAIGELANVANSFYGHIAADKWNTSSRVSLPFSFSKESNYVFDSIALYFTQLS